MSNPITKLIAAQHLRELMCSSVVGDMLHDVGDRDAIDLAQKLAARLSELARAEEVHRG
jgi:hypothetical protein